MTRADIIRMAREAGGTEMEPYDYGARPDRFIMRHEVLERFAALVAAAKVAEYQALLELQQRSYEREIQIEVEAEREECAQIADAESSIEGIAQRIAAAIRAKENT